MSEPSTPTPSRPDPGAAPSRLPLPADASTEPGDELEDASVDRSPSIYTIHAPVLRELEEPRDGREPPPTWLIFTFFALIGWGGWYLGTHAGGFQGDVYDPDPAAAYAVASVGDGDTEIDQVTLGRRVYNQCATCHQADGQGVAGVYPPLAGSERVLGHPEVLSRILLHGLQGPIEVAGQPYSGEMPAWGLQLDDREIASVLTYVRVQWGNDAAPVSDALVAGVRAETSGRAAAYRDPELDAVAATLGPPAESVASEAEPETPAGPEQTP